MGRGTARMRRGTQGHVAEPHESTWSSSGVMWRRRVAWAMRVHANARVAQRGRGGWQVKGPRVSGPSLDSRGGNAHALRRPSLYTRDFPFFLPCRTKLPRVLVFAGHMAASRASDTIARRPSRGLGSTQPSSRHVRQKGFK